MEKMDAPLSIKLAREWASVKIHPPHNRQRYHIPHVFFVINLDGSVILLGDGLFCLFPTLDSTMEPPNPFFLGTLDCIFHVSCALRDIHLRVLKR